MVSAKYCGQWEDGEGVQELCGHKSSWQDTLHRTPYYPEKDLSPWKWVESTWPHRLQAHLLLYLQESLPSTRLLLMLKQIAKGIRTTSALVGVSIIIIKHGPKATREGKGLFNFTLDSSYWKSGQELKTRTWGRNWSKNHEGTLFTGLLSWLAQFAFLRTTA